MNRSVLVATAVVLSAGFAQAAFTIAPYLQNRSGNSVVVRWQVAAPDSGRVEYGLTAGYGTSESDSAVSIDHELALAGLAPDTTYHYRVITGADTSGDAVFRSSVPTARSFRFLACSDHQDDSAAHQSVADRMALVEDPALLVNAGDIVQNGTTAQYRTYFNVERNLLKRVPLYPAIGNHDAESMPNWYRFYALPGNERWYSFRCGNAAFHALNVYDSVTPGSSQYEWLLSELGADSADPEVRHIFVYFHLPPYTTNTAYSGNADVRRYLCPLFERFSVRLVFSGHVHAYEHSLVNGVHYIITGGGGASLARNWNAVQPWTVYREATYEFVLLDVRGDTVFSRGVRPDGTEFDSLVVVTGQVGCAEPGDALKRPRGRGPRDAAVSFGSSQLRFTTGREGRVTGTLFDAAGREVARPLDTHLGAGEHRLQLDRRGLPAGVYQCVVRSGADVLRARVVVIR